MPGEALAFRADPDAIIRGADEPVLLDERLDIRDYLDLALRSGFPEALSIRSAPARQRWLEGHVAQVITRNPAGTVGARDPLRLSRYLEAYALNSAGITDAKRIYEAAGIDRGTATSHERVLENVFVVEALPAWRANRLKRLAVAPKRYVLDAGLMAASRHRTPQSPQGTTGPRRAGRSPPVPHRAAIAAALNARDNDEVINAYRPTRRRRN